MLRFSAGPLPPPPLADTLVVVRVLYTSDTSVVDDASSLLRLEPPELLPLLPLPSLDEEDE